MDDFFKLMQDLLDAGYMEDWTYNQTLGRSHKAEL